MSAIAVDSVRTRYFQALRKVPFASWTENAISNGKFSCAAMEQACTTSITVGKALVARMDAAKLLTIETQKHEIKLRFPLKELL
jgi:hypothetical protein